jgi:flagellar basal body rod protein FlgF
LLQKEGQTCRVRHELQKVELSAQNVATIATPGDAAKMCAIRAICAKATQAVVISLNDVAYALMSYL